MELFNTSNDRYMHIPLRDVVCKLQTLFTAADKDREYTEDEIVELVHQFSDCVLILVSTFYSSLAFGLREHAKYVDRPKERLTYLRSLSTILDAAQLVPLPTETLHFALKGHFDMFYP